MPKLEFESSSIFSPRNQPTTHFEIKKPNAWSLKELKAALYNQIRMAPIRQIMIITWKRIIILEPTDLSEVGKKKGKALRDFLNKHANIMQQARSVIIDAVNPVRNFIEKDLSLDGI